MARGRLDRVNPAMACTPKNISVTRNSHLFSSVQKLHKKVAKAHEWRVRKLFILEKLWGNCGEMLSQKPQMSEQDLKWCMQQLLEG